MSTLENQEVATEPKEDGGEGEETKEGEDSISIPKSDYEKLNQTLGSLKRELKDLKKVQEKPEETPKTNQPDDNLLQKTYLRAAQITAEDEVEFALETSKKWNMSVDKLVDDEDFQTKLGKLRTQKANELATSNIKGGTGSAQAKNTPEYWIQKGAPPSREEVPDRKTRATIARAMMESSKSGKKFYND